MSDAARIEEIRLRMSGGRPTMDRVTENLVTEFSQEHEITKFGEDKRFEHFCAFLMVGLHHPRTLEIEDLLMGKATGIDAIGIICNEELITDVETVKDIGSQEELEITFVFVQAKTTSGFVSDTLGGFGFAVLDFFSKEPKLARNPKIKAAAEIMSALYDRSSRFKRNPVCRLYYATTGIWNGDQILDARRKSVISDLKATNMFFSVECELVDAERLQKLYRQTKNAVECEFVFDRQIAIPEIPGVMQAYLGFVPVPEFRKVLADETGEMRAGLFNSNPRDWQGLNDVNEEIKKTLNTDEKSRFVLMNNGVTILAKEVRQTGSKFLLRDYQIVNGCQTSHLLFSEEPANDDLVMVPVRLISTKDEAVINSIIRANNRQTPVPEDQFFALEEFPKQLEEYFQAFSNNQRLYYERRSRQYDRLSVEKSRIITQPNVIKAFAAMFLDQAHSTTRNYSALKVRVTKDIFVKGHRKEPYYIGAYTLFKLESLFRSGRLDAEYKPARFHILLAAIRIATKNKPVPRMNSHDMEKFCSPILDLLWDTERSDELLLDSSKMINEVAQGNFDRDTVRTEQFTRKIIQRCNEDFGGKN